MLVKFWEFLDRPAPLNPVQATYFAKVIGVFLMKKTSDMLQFIKSQPQVVSKLLLHMSTSPIMDLLLKIISMEEAQEGKGTVQWLSDEGLMPWLVNRLDPNFDPEVHSVASQVLLDIIAISQSSHPEQPSIGTNVLIDELKSETIVSKLVSFMLDRNAPHSTSTLINGVTIFIELIRRNNSDYDVEPLPPGSTEPIREAVDLGDLLKVLASRIEDFKGLLLVPRSVTGPIDTSIGKQVPLGFERLKICEMFAELLHCSNMAILNSKPIITACTDGTVKVPTVIADQPLIYHSQTVKDEMDSLLAAATEDPAEPAKKDDNGQQTVNTTDEKQDENVKGEANKDEAKKEDVKMDDAKKEDTKKDEALKDETKANEPSKDEVNKDEANKDEANKDEASKDKTDKEATKDEQPPSTPSGEPKSATEQLEKATAALVIDDQATPRASPPLGSIVTFAKAGDDDTTPALDPSSAPARVRPPPPTDVLVPVGDFLKMQFVDHQIIPTCFDLFFQFPWNNFLHTVVYDMVHQVFHRPMGDIGRPDMDGTYIPPKNDQGVTEGWNRRLTVSIFKDGQLTKRITDAQRLCDFECSQPKGVRLGYMGHLTYIADETVKLLELYSTTSLLPMLYEFIEVDDWWNYVTKVLKETKERDAQVLGGTRPNMMEPHKALDDVHDDDFLDDHGEEYGSGSGFLGGDGTVGHDRDVASDQFARYLSQQITNNMPEKFGSSDEDDDDEENNWIGEYGPDTDFDRRRAAAAAAAASGLDDPYAGNRLMDYEDSDEDEGVDEETWNSAWPNNNMGPPAQFSATMTDWSEDFTEFKSAATGDEGFDFPPFSVAQAQADKTEQGAAGGVDPFGDNFAVSSTGEAAVASGTTTVPETAGANVTQDTTTETTSKVDIEPVVLAPVVQQDPVVEQSASSTTLAATTQSSTGSAPVELEKVPLADPEAPKLQATTTESSATNGSNTSTATTAAKEGAAVDSAKT
ncbi:hypothetical protein BGX31_009026 [Mortierella sp. GBA43]|nr:hypothetical protein BGX31_009026 [Mortierella sp. GBA43]